MSDVTRDVLDTLHARMTEQATVTATIAAEVKAGNKQVDRLVTALQGNGQIGLIRTVSQQGTRLEAMSTRLKEQRSRSMTIIAISVTVASIVVSAVVSIVIHFAG